MKKLIYFAPILFLFSCVHVRQMGELNMVSTRNVENTEYKLIKNYQGATKNQLKSSKAKDLNHAIDQTVKNTPGGEYLKNAKVYVIVRPYRLRYAVEGDVWGVSSEEISFKGFKVGDRVQWKTMKKVYTGVITNLKDGTHATIKKDDTDILENVKYEKLTKF
jgi:hypothetical protein